MQTSKIGSLLDVQESKDPEGLRIFYYLVQAPPPSALLLCPSRRSNCSCKGGHRPLFAHRHKESRERMGYAVCRTGCFFVVRTAQLT